ncbi:MAG TPA: hypothetical protein PK450_07340 [Paracoccaceae bacterium]|nr:hypothetical protein [Paracoccaceae bacterium]
MRPHILPICLAAPLLLAVGAGAEEGWSRLAGADITLALTARHLVYEDGATQQFNADGGTVYDAGRPSQGRWRVEGEEYCSLWPPSDRWSCYGVERSSDGLALRFVTQDGSASVGRYDDL